MNSNICYLIAEKLGLRILNLMIKTLFLCIIEERNGIVCQQRDLSPFVTLNHSKTQYITIKVTL